MPKMPSSLHRSKEEMPGDSDGGGDEGGGENRAGLAPSPAVEKPGDGGQDHIAPVGEAHVGDVRDPEENGGGPPAREIALGRARKQILEQAAEEELFGPSSEEENAEGNEGQRPQLRPLRIELNEMDCMAHGDGDARENDEACRDEEAQMVAPADGVADAIDAAQKQETSKRDVHAEKNRENVGETSAGVRPEPMRQRPSPGIGQRLHGNQNEKDRCKILPCAGWFARSGSGESKRKQDQRGDSHSTSERESICPQGINQVDKKHRGAKQVTAAGAEARGDAIFDYAVLTEQHHQEERLEGRELGSESAAD